VRVLAVTVLLGCGRVDFAPVVDNTAVPAVCGDGVCAGGAGELCSTCSDCITLDPVCGNGECSAGEEATCYADCGPSPWAWPADSSVMLSALNQARTNGTRCPGAAGTVTAPALVYDQTLEPAAREWAWEAAHENWTSPDGCNGRTATERIAAVGATSGWKAFAASSGGNAITMLLAYGPACTELMKASNTRFAGVGAHDAITAHAIMLK
jgi:hypothetical protein